MTTPIKPDILYWKNKPKPAAPKTYWNRRFEMARMISAVDLHNLENGGPEHLDIAALKERLAKRGIQ